MDHECIDIDPFIPTGICVICTEVKEDQIQIDTSLWAKLLD